MSTQPQDNKAERLAAALGRVEFWSLWAAESTSQCAIDYFKSRERHWQHAANAIELEP